MTRNILSLLAAVCVAGSSLFAESWPNWRGPSLDGVSRETNLPTRWSATENVAWKLPLPAFSGSTPVIWNDLVFLNVATARATGQIELWTVDRRTQQVVWRRPIVGENRIGNKQNMSSPSPVTDGQRVWVMSGTGVLKAFDVGGRELWARNLQQDMAPSACSSATGRRRCSMPATCTCRCCTGSSPTIRPTCCGSTR